MAMTPDFDSYPIDFTITSVSVRERWVEVVWADGRLSRFHHMWLRDNCPCAGCVHQGTKEQTFELVAVSDDVHPTAATLTDDGSVSVVWSNDAHVSDFHAGWLRENCYSDEARAERVTPRPRPAAHRQTTRSEHHPRCRPQPQLGLVAHERADFRPR